MVVAAIGSVIAWQLWEALQDENEPVSTTIRNVALIVGGLIAVLLAMWRSRVAERQADTAQQGLLYDRYQRGAQMLGGKVFAVRIAGIYALQRLAEEKPAQYHIQVMQLFCAFVRNPTVDDTYRILHPVEGSQAASIREDIQAAMNAIGSRSDEGIALERGSAGFTLDLNFADLRGADLDGRNLSGAQLRGANLSGATLHESQLIRTRLMGANLSRTSLVGANLSFSRLREANFSEAFMLDADLSNTYIVDADFSCANLHRANLFNASLQNVKLFGTNFRDANLSKADIVRYSYTVTADSADIGLTQAQLDEARASPKYPPDLKNIFDADTGEPLVWRERPREDGT